MSNQSTALVNNDFLPLDKSLVRDDFRALESRIPLYLKAEARRDLLLLLKDVEYQTERAKIIEMTAGKKKAIYDRIDEIFRNFGTFGDARNEGEYAKQSSALVESVRGIVAEELAEHFSNAKRINDVLSIKESKDVRFNYPLIDTNTVSVPLDLHLAFGPKDTVDGAISRLLRQYRGRYNAIIVTNETGKPIGLLSLEELKKYDGETRLEDVGGMVVPEKFATLGTKREEAEQEMHKLGVNVFPVVDSKGELLIGILTKESVVKIETRLYTTQLQTSIAVHGLHEETSHAPQNNGTPQE